MKKIITIILLLFIAIPAYARELCDCFGTCVPIYERDVSWEMKKQVKARDGYSVHAKVEIDHKLPLCLGGSNNISNLQALTRHQHHIKTERDMEVLYYVNQCYMTIEEARQSELNYKAK